MFRPEKRLLVVEGYDPAGIAKLAEAGATKASLLYKRMLGQYVDEQLIDIAEMSAPDAPQIDPSRYAGICWTGSNLFFSEKDDLVQRHIDWCRTFFEEGIPQMGSFWGAQLAAVAAGGKCEANPKGREFGVGRKILLTDEGRSHPMYDGKHSVFDGFESHGDIITQMPEGGVLLAGNAFSPVQALDVTHLNGRFWAFQYHPEYDFAEIGALAIVRKGDLVSQGSFKSEAAVMEFANDMRVLNADASRAGIMWKWGLDDDLADPAKRTLEVKNWLRHMVEGSDQA